MRSESRQAVRAVFLAAIIVVSVFSAGVAFSGSAAAEVNSVGSAANLTAPQAPTGHTISGVELSSPNTNVTVAVPTQSGLDYSGATAQVGGTTVNDSLNDGENFTIAASDINSSSFDLTIVGINTTSDAIGANLNYTIYQSGTSANASFGVEATYADTGDGTASDPYEIDDWNDLDAVGANLDANYTLVDDLGPSDQGYDTLVNTSNGFEPIDAYFTGNFDGSNHTISNLKINRRGTDFVGLFRYTGRESTISNIKITDSTVEGTSYVGVIAGGTRKTSITNINITNSTANGLNYVGLLAGVTRNTHISQTSVTGNVTADGYDRTNRAVAGGTVGWIITSSTDIFGNSLSYPSNTVGIVDSYADVDVDGGGGSVGGLVGKINGKDQEITVARSAAVGNVNGFGTGRHFGGAIGYAFNNVSIKQIKATGNVSGSERVGGLVGTTGSPDQTITTTITQSAATGSVNGSSSTGGLVGFVEDTTKISSSYTTADVTNHDRYAGGFIGSIGTDAPVTIERSFAAGSVTAETSNPIGFDDFIGQQDDTVTNESVYYDDSIWTGSEGIGYGTALTTSEIQGAAALDNMGGLDFTPDGTWIITLNDYPKLRTFTDAETPVSIDDDYYRTIQQGVTDAVPGETVEVEPGTYNETVTIATKNITLKSTAGADRTIVNTNNTDEFGTGIVIEADEINITGLTVIGGHTYGFKSSGGGIEIIGADNVTIKNSNISGYGPVGVQGNINSLTLDNNNIHNGYLGARLDQTTNSRIIENEFYDLVYGIQMTSYGEEDSTPIPQNNIIRGNTFDNITDQPGLEPVAGAPFDIVIQGSNITIKNNRITGGGGAGVIAQEVVAGQSATLSDLNIANNSIYGHTNYGVRAYDGDGGDWQSPPINATLNWWGSPDGPGGQGPGSGDNVSANVVFKPFYTNATRTELSSANYSVSITSLNSSVAVGEVVVAEYNVTNIGEEAGNQTIVLEVNATGAEIPNQTNVALTPGESFTDTFNYTASAEDRPAIDVTVASTNDTVRRTVVVLQPTASIESVDSVSAGDSTVTTNVQFANTAGDNVTIDVVDSSDSSIASSTETIASNGSVTVSLSRAVANENIDVVVYESDALDNELTRQTVTVPPFPQPDPATFEVSLTAPDSVTAGKQVSVTATIANTGDQSGTQTIIFSVNGTQEDSTTVSLDAGESDDVSFAYTTSSGDTPAVTVGVSSDDDSASSTVAVTKRATPSFAVTTIEAPDTVTAGEAIDVSATIENTGGRAGAQTITFTVGETQESSTTVSLDAGESEEITFAYTTSSADTPEVTVTVASANDSARSAVAVTQPAVPSFAVTNVSAPQTVTAGDDITVSATIANTGGESGTQPVRLLVDGTQEAVAPVTLAAGENTTKTFTYAVSESATTQFVDVTIVTANVTRGTEVQINGTLDRTPLVLEANQTTLVSGEPVAFTVTDDAGTPVNATVRVAGTERQTGADGAVVITIDTPGRFDAIATKEPTTDTEFAPATLGLTVSAPTLTIAQQTASFGDLRVGTSETTGLLVSNTAPTPISIDSVTVTGPDADTFSVDTELSNELPADTEGRINITFEPETRGTADATLRINDQTVSLSGTGTAPELDITTDLPVELTAAPDESATTSVTISNDGNAPLTATLSSGDRFSQPDTLTVAAQSTATFDVEFAPQDGDNTTVSTQLTIAPESETLSPVTIPLLGTVTDRDVSIRTRTVTLGNITVSETTTAGVIVVNTGTTTETFTTTTDTPTFEVTPDDSEFTLAPGAQTFLSIEATPTAPGAVTGTLTVETDDGEVRDTATLTATGQAPDVEVAVDSLAFGTTPLNSTTTQAVEITNDGTAPLTIDIAETLTGTAFTPVGESRLTIPAGGSQSLPIGFTPQTAGETTANLTLATNDPDTQRRRITLTGSGVETSVALSPSTVSFGTVGVSSSTTETVTLTNDGSSFTVEQVTVEGAPFEADSDLAGTTLTENETVSIDLVFDPTTRGSRTGTVTVSGSTETDSTEVSAALTGTAQTATLEVNSQTLRTGVAVAEGTTTGSVAVANTGLSGTQLTIDELTLNNTDQFSLSDEGLTPGTTVAGGTRQPIVVAFEPTTPEEGVKQTTLTLEASSGEQTFTRTISVTGTVSAPDPTASTETLAVGSVPVGESIRRTVTISNDGGEPFSIESVVTDTDGVTAQRLGPSEVVPGDERTIVVVVNQSTAGRIDTTVDVATTAATDPSVAVTGEVVAPEFSVVTDTVDFGETSTGSAAQRTVTIDNTGAAPLTVASPTISGPDSTAFSILSGDQRLTIPSNSSETLVVGFAPPATGEQTATLLVNPQNDPTVAEPTEITLTGTGTASDVGLNDSTVGLGTIQLGRTQTQTVALTNDGSERVEITGASVTGSDRSAVSVIGLQQRILQPGESETFGIEVATTGRDRGRLTAQVSITTTDTTVSSSVGATVASPDLSVRGSAGVDAFGTTRVGSTSTASLDIENTGNADLTLTDIAITGSDAAAFTIVEQPTGDISPQSADQLVVEFSPTALPNAAARAQNTPLEANATLTIDHNAGSTRTIALIGEAETAALTTPPTFQFGETPIGDTVTRQLTVENTVSATTDITVTGVELSGSDAAEYEARLSKSEPPIELAPGEATTVNVSLTPGSLARKFATLSVQTADPRQPVQKIGLSNTETVYTVEYGSVTVQYINPTTGREPLVNVDRGLRGRNATLTRVTSDVNTTANYKLHYGFGPTAEEIGTANSLTTDTPVQYIKATTTAPDERFNDSTIRIEVSKAVLASQNATPDNVTIYHQDGNGYAALETTQLFETTRGYVYEVTTDSYSIFVVGVESIDGDGGDGDDGDGGDGDDGDGGDGDDGDGGDGDDGDGGDGGDGITESQISVEGSVVAESSFDGRTLSTRIDSAVAGSSVTSSLGNASIKEYIRNTGASLNSLTATFADDVSNVDIDATYTATTPSEETPGFSAANEAEAIAYIIVDTTAPEDDIDSVTFEFSVTRERLSEAGLSPDEVALYRFNDGQYNEYDATVTSSGDNRITYTTEVPGLSAFAIAKETDQVTGTATAEPEPDTLEPEPDTPEPDPDPKVETDTPIDRTQEPGGFGLLPVAVIVIILLAAGAYLAVRRN